MRFAATDPLSEIVWSPDKGLSLKCADSSFADRNNSLFRDVGPSGVALAPLRSVTGSRFTADEPIDDVFVKPIAVICAKSDIAATDTPTMQPTGISGSGGNVEKIDTAGQASDLPNDQNENLVNDGEKNARDQVHNGTDKISGTGGNKLSAMSGEVGQRPFSSLLLQSDARKSSAERNPSPGRSSNEGTGIGAGKKTTASDDAVYGMVEPVIEYKGSDVPAPWTNVASSSKSLLEKRESTAENDLRTSNDVAACAGMSRVLVNESKTKSQDNEVTRPCDETLPVLASQCNSRILMTINKGKEKSLSDGDADARLLKWDNDSNSSVESCNSGGFFSTCKKRCNFQLELMIGSKRVKKQIQEASGSKSNVKQDSSFMNWISNMVKGFSQSVQDGLNTMPLALPNPDHHYPQPDQKLTTCNANQDPEQKNTGFKSIFQSIYCPNSKNVGTRLSHQEGEGCENLEPGNMIHGIDATPITCCAENNNLNRQYLQTNDAGPSSRPKIKPLNFFNSLESSKDVRMENISCSILGLSKDKEEMASHSSSTRQNSNNTENFDSKALCERKETQNIYHRSDNWGSRWRTRFSSKSVAPSIISDRLNERGESQVQPTDFSKLPSSHKRISYFNNCKIEETRELFADGTGLKEDEGNNDHKSKHNFIPLSSSTGFRNSESMASTLARRLGAIKHIMPTNSIDCTSNEGSVRLLTGEDDRFFSGGPINDETSHQEERNLNLKRKSNEVIDSKTGCSSSSFKKCCSSSSEENKLRENPVASPPGLAKRKTLEVPTGISDAVRKLRLSRTDILKWIKGNGSISELDGFFLRLRLGKWEEGLGGTGYHVASINEARNQSSEQNTRKSVSVNVGGIKCMVESQYISNQDFLEEEIMEWWSTKAEADAEIPSEEDLMENLKRKKLLGL